MHCNSQVPSPTPCLFRAQQRSLFPTPFAPPWSDKLPETDGVAFYRISSVRTSIPITHRHPFGPLWWLRVLSYKAITARYKRIPSAAFPLSAAIKSMDGYVELPFTTTLASAQFSRFNHAVIHSDRLARDPPYQLNLWQSFSNNPVSSHRRCFSHTLLKPLSKGKHN